MSSMTVMAGLSVQRQASRLSRAALPAAMITANASTKAQPRSVPWPGSAVSSRHNGTLQAVASQALASTTTQAGWMSREWWGGCVMAPEPRLKTQQALQERRHRCAIVAEPA